MISKKSLEAEKTAVWNELLGGFSAEEARVEMEKQPPSSASFFFCFSSMKIPFSLSFSVAFATNCVWHSCPVFSPLGSSLEAWLF